MRQSTKPISCLGLTLSVLLVVLIWAGFAVLPRFTGKGVAKTGPWGDTFGGLTALFSGLAMLGAAYAVILQNQQLEETRQELRDDAKARENTDALIERQAQALLAQARINATLALLGTSPGDNLIKDTHIPGFPEWFKESDVLRQYLRIVLADVESRGLPDSDELPPQSSVYRRYLYSSTVRHRRSAQLWQGQPDGFARVQRLVSAAVRDMKRLGCHDEILLTGDLPLLERSLGLFAPFMREEAIDPAGQEAFCRDLLQAFSTIESLAKNPAI